MHVCRPQKWRQFLEYAGAPIHQFENLVVPSDRFERLSHHAVNGGGQRVGHLAIETVHILEMPEHRAQPDPGALGDLLGARRHVSLGHQLEHRGDNSLLAVLRALDAAVGLL